MQAPLFLFRGECWHLSLLTAILGRPFPRKKTGWSLLSTVETFGGLLALGSADVG